MAETISNLFKEKQANKPKKVVKAAVVKKIKKKDIPIIPIYERELQYYEYDEVSNIKIYNGVLIKNKDIMLSNITFYQMISPCDKFTQLQPSTLTSRGEFSNTSFKEESFIKVLEIPINNYMPIVKIGSNYGEIYTFPNPFINHPINAMVKSILSLHDVGVIKIGCGCNPLLDTSAIHSLAISVNNTKDSFVELYTQFIKDKIMLDKHYTKKKSAKIIKNFTNIQLYQILDSDDIKDMYIVIEQYLPNKQGIDECNRYIDNIIKIIQYFTDYESKCTCIKKFVEQHSLQHIDRNKLVKKVKGSTRGRKPKQKKKVKRKIQGVGNYFSSQISFEMYNYHNDKITKIKIFRNGNYQIPGVKNPDMSDLIDSILLLKDYLNYIKCRSNDADSVALQESLVEIPYIISVMRNYTCRLTNPDVTIILNKLEDVLYFEKNIQITSTQSTTYINTLDKLKMSKSTVHDVFKYCNIGFYQISEISLNIERYSGLLVKFLRPIPGNETKKLTIKILSSGKINMDGSTSELEVFEIYYWLQYIFNKYWSEIVFDPSVQLNEVVSSDSESGYESIYDDA